jgi:hypothetical protein
MGITSSEESGQVIDGLRQAYIVFYRFLLACERSVTVAACRQLLLQDLVIGDEEVSSVWRRIC